MNNIVDILSLILQIENLQENREQSAHNDVQTANDQQADFLLAEISKRLDRQDEILKRIEKKIDRQK